MGTVKKNEIRKIIYSVMPNRAISRTIIRASPDSAQQEGLLVLIRMKESYMKRAISRLKLGGKVGLRWIKIIS